MLIKNGLIFDLQEGFVARDLCTDGQVISNASSDNSVLDAEGCYVIPALVDVHFHGAMGEDFSDATREGLQRIADYELSEGVTYICPTSMTLPEETDPYDPTETTAPPETSEVKTRTSSVSSVLTSETPETAASPA